MGTKATICQKQVWRKC